MFRAVQAMASMWMTRPDSTRDLIHNLHKRTMARHGPPPPELWPKVLVRTIAPRDRIVPAYNCHWFFAPRYRMSSRACECQMSTHRVHSERTNGGMATAMADNVQCCRFAAVEANVKACRSDAPFAPLLL